MTHCFSDRRALARVATSLPLVLAALGVAALPSAASGAGGSAASPASVSETGELVELVADDFARGTARTLWALERDNRSFVAVEGLDPRTAERLVGRQVTVRGKALGRHRLRATSVAAATGSGESPTSTAASASTAQAYKRVGVVMLNFTDDPSQPVTPEQLRTTLEGSTTDVDDHLHDSSDGQLGIDADVFGWVTVDRTSASSCDYSAWGNAARTAVTGTGVDLSSYEHVMYFWPQQSACSWAGLGQLPGSTTWINGSNTTRVLGHEIAHNLGEHHASAAGSCTEGGASVIIPTATASCTVSEYGDPFTIMGSSSYYLHTAATRVHRSWLQATTAVAGEAGAWTLAPVDAGSGLRLLRVPRGDGSFLSLEFRQPHGAFDTFASTAPVSTGVTVRLDHGVGSRQTVLFDANPATATYGDAAFGVGRSVTDPVSGATITVDSVSTAGAQVSVRYGGSGGGSDPTDPTGTTDPTDPTPPGDTTAPTAVTRLKASVRRGTATLTWRAATDDTGSVEYVVTRGATTATTSTTRWSETPGDGTHTYSVVARDAAGNTSSPAQVVVDLAAADSSTGTSGKGKGGRKR